MTVFRHSNVSCHCVADRLSISYSCSRVGIDLSDEISLYLILRALNAVAACCTALGPIQMC